MAAIFIVSCFILGSTLWIALPTLEDADRPALRIPKSFAQLQGLNQLLKKYRDIYPYRIVICYVTTYLFLQAFSLPGSMYLSILGGAVWGVPRALLLACACVATGATLCYLISAALGPALLTLPSWRARFATWSEKVTAQRANLMSFLIVIRIAPLPPHWVVNILCPHVGIGIVPFWLSTFMGVFGVTVIHTTIGGGLDEMTSAADFHLLSFRNFMGLAAIVIGVLIPVGLRFYFKQEAPSSLIAADMEEEEEALLANDEESQLSVDRTIAAGPPLPPAAKQPSQQPLFYHDDDEEYADEDEDEEDPIIEAGPAIVAKHIDDAHVPVSSSASSSTSRL